MRILGNIFWIILGAFALLPFGRELVTRPEEPGCLTVAMNLAWVLVGFWEIALVHLALCIVFCVTIVGIPWGVQHFKMAVASIFPFGKEIKAL